LVTIVEIRGAMVWCGTSETSGSVRRSISMNHDHVLILARYSSLVEGVQSIIRGSPKRILSRWTKSCKSCVSMKL
jgi:hypothetical protein